MAQWRRSTESGSLQAPLEGWRVARCGDYGVALQIIEDDGVILIGRIEHRTEVYRT